ncbi:MAG: hypothetical protein J0H98_02195 [Solirubrobacterales bacterium]|nr:hypothetical protein [Solirubrobacterales bacterium]
MSAATRGLIIASKGIWMSHSLPDAQTCADDPSHPGCDSSNPCANGPSSECCALQPRFAPCNEETAKPRLAISVSPKVKRARAGHIAVLTVKVRNSGDAPATGVRVCAKALRSKAQVGKCLSGAVAAGRTMARRFRVKVRRSARGKVRVGFKLTAGGLPVRKATATIKVSR